MSMMLHIQPYELPMKTPWPDGNRTRIRARTGFIVRLFAGELQGKGDCAPWPAMGTETPEQALDYLTEWQKGRKGNIRQLLDELETAGSTCPAAVHALETALLDILGQQRSIPLRHLLKEQAPDHIHVNAMAGSACDNRAVAEVAEGFRVIKLKMGRAPVADEIRCLQTLSGKLPGGIRLRLDANGAWSPDEAARVLQALEGLPVESLEEPLKQPKLEDLDRLQHETGIHLALDESLKRFPLAEVLDSRLPRLVIKPSVQGGLRSSFQLASRAAASGKETVITSLVESAIGLHAAAQLAAAVSCPVPDLSHGLATATWLREDVASPPAIEAGCMHLSLHPGLGIG
ncbi:o-succinylbenzoate synthase [Thiolapillus sp.]